MKIIEYNVYGIAESLRASGYPLSTDINEVTPSLARGMKLGRAKVGSGHDCYLKGITVIATIEAPLPFWGQWERYSFQDTISSTSQMHKLKDKELTITTYDEAVDEDIIEIMRKLQEDYNKQPTEDNFRKLVMNNPQGFLYTRAITTNYLQLKTMYYQRKGHKLREWRILREWMEELPLFLDLIGEV